MGVNDIIDARKRYKILYKNYLSVMWNIWRGKDKVKVILQNGNESSVSCYLAKKCVQLIDNKNIQIYDLPLGSHDIKFTYNGKSISITLEDGTGAIGDVFAREEYSFLNVKNEIVLDIGANIGDSPIYFALNNAKKVIALEPYPYSYNIALSNIKKNDIEDKIILLNAGYGQDGTINVNPDFVNTGCSDLKSFDDGMDIKIFSLKTLLSDYNIDKAILKMDCEGCEYNLLKEDNDTLKKFKRIQIEYHYGYKRLEQKLIEADFEVKHSKPEISKGSDEELKNVASQENDMTFGYIYAEQN